MERGPARHYLPVNLIINSTTLNHCRKRQCERKIQLKVQCSFRRYRYYFLREYNDTVVDDEIRYMHRERRCINHYFPWNETFVLFACHCFH